MRQFQCFQNTRFLQLSVLFKLVKDEIPDEGRNDQMMRCRMPHKTEEDLSETKSISAKNKKIQITLGICLAPCIGAEEIDFLHMIFFRERLYQ